MFVLCLGRTQSVEGNSAWRRPVLSVVREARLIERNRRGVRCKRRGAVAPGGGPHSWSSVRRGSLSMVGVAGDGARWGGGAWRRPILLVVPTARLVERGRRG